MQIPPSNRLTLVYPGDKPVMAITVDLIIVPSSKITSVSPSLVAVSIDEPILVPDDEVELEKLVASSDADLDEVIKFGSLCSVMIPEKFLPSGISTANVVANNPVYHNDLGNLHDGKTVVAGNKTKTYRLNKVDTTVFYGDSPQAQMDSDTGVSIINSISLLHNVKYFNDKFKSCFYIHGASRKEIITTCAFCSMRVRVLTRQRYLDVKCYYLPHFNTTLLSQVSIIETTGQPKQYIS